MRLKRAALRHSCFAPEAVPHPFGGGVCLLISYEVRDGTKVTQCFLERPGEPGSVSYTGTPGCCHTSPREAETGWGGRKCIHLEGASCLVAAATVLPLHPLFSSLRFCSAANSCLALGSENLSHPHLSSPSSFFPQSRLSTLWSSASTATPPWKRHLNMLDCNALEQHGLALSIVTSRFQLLLILTIWAQTDGFVPLCGFIIIILFRFSPRV